MTNAGTAVSMYERIGGAPTIERLVESFYVRMDTLPEARTIRAMHAADLAPGEGGAAALSGRVDGRAEALFGRARPSAAAPAPPGLSHRQR
jgi:hypothetical protein